MSETESLPTYVAEPSGTWSAAGYETWHIVCVPDNDVVARHIKQGFALYVVSLLNAAQVVDTRKG